MAKTETKQEKPTAREKRALKRRETAAKADAVFGVGRGFGEPEINPLNYRVDLIKALNHYNAAEDNKTKRKWALSYISRKNKNHVKALDEVKDYEFSSLGVLCRLHDRNQHLEESELKYIDKRIKELLKSVNAAKSKSQIKTVTELPKKLRVDRSAELLQEICGEIDGMLDDFLKEDKDFDLDSLLKSKNVSSVVARQIPAKYEKLLSELEEVQVGKDKQLVEGWSNLKKMKLKKFISVLKTIATTSQQQVVSAKTTRKPRVKKEKPASVLAAKVNYMQEFKELSLKSIHPTNLVGASEVWIYNTKYKKLQVYRSLDGQKLSVKGTSLVNWDVAQSSSKTLRKPEVTKEVLDMTKRTFAAFFKKLTTKEAIVNGRIGAECIILKIV